MRFTPVSRYLERRNEVAKRMVEFHLKKESLEESVKLEMEKLCEN